MADIIPIPGMKASPPRAKKLKGTWGDRERQHARNTMPDGRKRVRKTVEFPDGTKSLVNFTGATLTEARAKCDAFIADLEAKKNAPPASESAPTRPELDPGQTLAQWATRWNLAYAKGGDKHQRNTTSIVNLIKESDLGSMPLGDIRKIDVQKFANKHVHSKSYTAKIKMTLNSIFEDAVDNDIVPKNPCRKVSWEDVGETNHRELTDMERDLITAHWRVHPAGVGAMLMLYTGMRPEEARVLLWDNVGKDHIVIRDSSYYDRSGRLVVKKGSTKTDAGQRQVPIAPQLRGVLSSLDRKPGEFVWQSASGEPLTQSAYRRNWSALISALKCVKLGIAANKLGNYSGIRTDRLEGTRKKEWGDLFDGVTPYNMRPTYCTMIYEGGVDEKMMQYLMGHSSIEITLRVYARLRAQHKQAQGKSVMDFFTSLAKKQRNQNKSGT